MPIPFSSLSGNRSNARYTDQVQFSGPWRTDKFSAVGRRAREETSRPVEKRDFYPSVLARYWLSTNGRTDGRTAQGHSKPPLH